MELHKPVLIRETLEYWHAKDGGFYVDGTVGLGGHAEALLQADPGARLLGLDVDGSALEHAGKRLSVFGGRAILRRESYVNLAAVLERENLPKADGLLLDMGCSSIHLDRAERGFSFRNNGPLDMRMDASSGETALELIHRLSERELERVIREYGEETLAHAIADGLKTAERKGRLTGTMDCAEVISQVVFSKAPWRKKGLHPATKTFQALRIAVNGELSNIDRFMGDFPSVLSHFGHAVFIAFHSLEDRRVKNALHRYAHPCTCPADFPQCVCGGKPELKILTRKAVVPGEAETRDNPRSRSAKLRAAEKI